MTAATSPSIRSESDNIRDVAAAAVASECCELPTLPEVATRLLNLTSDVECDPADIVALFRRDQSLTGHLLRTANSARYNSGQTVTSVQHAVARLGLNQVREVVMLISCGTTVFNVSQFEKDVRRSFERSLATAAFSQEIARTRRLNVEDAFLCGLLHDVGRPVLLQILSDSRRMSAASWTDDDVISAADDSRVAMAVRLVRAWTLPDRIATTIQHQATPLEAGELEVQAAVLTMAADIAERLLAGELNSSAFSHSLADLLNLYPEELSAILSKRDTIMEWVKATA